MKEALRPIDPYGALLLLALLTILVTVADRVEAGAVPILQRGGTVGPEVVGRTVSLEGWVMGRRSSGEDIPQGTVLVTERYPLSHGAVVLWGKTKRADGVVEAYWANDGAVIILASMARSGLSEIAVERFGDPLPSQQ